MTPQNTEARLRREVSVLGATGLGLGSILGTGVFVSLALAAGATGPSVVLAVTLAALVATCNALSSAQLAAAHPVSGGTYEYGYRYLSPMAGFTAGWMFLAAKSASAATAALGVASYLVLSLGADGLILRLGLALVAVLAITLLVLGGLRRSSLVNLVIVSITLITLCAFCFSTLWAVWFLSPQRGLPVGAPVGLPAEQSVWVPFFLPRPTRDPVSGFLEATALAFVAYTGYGRIATLGEEVRQPRQTIPRAILATLLISAAVYLAVVCSAVSIAGSAEYARLAQGPAAPLAVLSARLGVFGLPQLVALGAITSMLGVLLNLILGLSRVALAMGRRRDCPDSFAQVDPKGQTPTVAVIFVAVVVGGLVLVGDVSWTWSLSAWTVLIYYGLTNLAALRLPPAERLYPRVFAWSGLIACLGLTAWIPWQVWGVGVAVLAVGLLWRTIWRQATQKS